MNGNRNTVQTGKAASVRQVALTALAFACFIAYCRVYTDAMVASVFSLDAAQAEQVSTMCSEGRLVAIVLLMLAGSARARIVNRTSLMLAGTFMVLGAVCMELSGSAVLQGVSALVSGLASGVCAFALVTVLSSQSFRTIVASGLCGLVLGGALMGAVMAQPLLFGEVVLIACSLGCLAGLLFVDPTMECYDDHGVFDRAELRRFPWFASVMIVVCGVIGTLLYQAAVSLAWGQMDSSGYAVMGIAALAVILSTCAIVAFVDNWTQVVWVPLFVLLAGTMGLLCAGPATLDASTLGLLLAVILSFHFLRFVVVPAIVSTSLLPRYFTNGVLLVLTNAALAVNLGSGAFQSLSAGMQTPGGLGGMLALGLAVALAAIALVDRMDRAAEYEEPYERDSRPTQTAVQDATVPDDDATEHDDASVLAAAGAVTDAEPLTLEECCEQLADEFELTAREREIFSFTARGHSSKAIAEQLVISSSTVRFHQQNLYKKLGVHSRQELIALVESRSA